MKSFSSQQCYSINNAFARGCMILEAKSFGFLACMHAYVIFADTSALFMETG